MASDSDDDLKCDDAKKSDRRDRSPSPDIKSTAVVKYSSVKCPIGYSKLQCNTDLKMPPSNWLSCATDSYGLQHALNHSAVFSSFRMAHMFPDCVGQVDVVSGAECIKSLLKLPYHTNGVVSIIVHRVENTLLLDDFDIYQYLMKSEWSWMKKFFYEKFLKSISVKERGAYAKNKSRCALQQKSLVSKFLYHSLPSSSIVPESGDQDRKRLQSPSLPSAGPSLPDPDIQKTMPQSSPFDHPYNRNVVWTFENLQMLIGTDMPIFGGVDRPCVSLRLHDAGRPINVLTGIDYWLDNLMCNVPEVIMCYHLDGIVSKYEPIKTEELPNMKDSKFSPKVIRNVAQNILSFLKSNATKAGHTYWLFKGTDDDVVKLYDLSTLCGTTESPADENPFTVPVAMLLYRVARNMKTPCQAGHIKMLLENCIKLLPVEKYPHIVASSHFMLANLYIPTNTDPISPNLNASPTGECECGDPSSCRRQEDYDDEINSDRMMFNMKDENSEPLSGTKSESNKPKKEKLISGDVAVRSLSAPSNPVFTPTLPPPLVSGKLEERCHSALNYVKNGLSALKYYSKEKDLNNSKKKNEDNPKMAKPFEPIPMGYKTLNNSENDFLMAQSNIPISLPYTTDEKLEEKKIDRCSRRKKRDGKNKKKSILENNNIVNDDAAKRKIDGVILRKDNAVPTLQEPSTNDDISWKIHLKLLLYEKARLSFITLAEQHFGDGHYGLSFKNLRIAQKCQNILNRILNSDQQANNCVLMGRIGDNLFQFAKYWTEYQSEYSGQIEAYTEEEQHMLREIEADLVLYLNNNKNSTNDIADFDLPTDQEDAIVKSVEYYTSALKIAPKEKKEEMLRRVASAKNELGVKYMYNAQEQFTLYCNNQSKLGTKKSKELTLYESLSKKSFACLTESAKIFEQVNDLPNLALLHCNTGRFMRLRAHCNQTTHSPEQRKLYAAAIDHYGQALRLLAGENCESVRNLVRWELSTALYTQACLLQDFPPDIPDPAKEAAEALRLALRNCPLSEGPRQCLYQFRAGLLHQRLGSLYHKQFRDPSQDQVSLRTAVALSRANYEKAVQLFLPLEETTMFLKAQLEHLALTEYQANNCPGLKLKFLQMALDLLQQCEPILKLIMEKDVASKSTMKSADENITDAPHADDDVENDNNLLVMFEQMLQGILKSLVQLCTQKPPAWKKDNEMIMKFYKNAYSLTLKAMGAQHNKCNEFAKHLYEVLIAIKN